MEQAIAAGQPGLIKHVSLSISAVGSGVRYQAVTVSRVTKARVFVRVGEGSREREFRRDNLREYGEKEFRADLLILDPEAVAKAVAEQEAEQARRSLEGKALVALSEIRGLFEGYAVRNRSEAEIAAIVALRDSMKAAAVSG